MTDHSLSERRESPALYQEIEQWLRAKVMAGREGDALPSEADLAAQFGVSRMTSRQAMQNLASEGLVRRQRGSGTFIAPRPMHRHAGPLMNFTSDMRRRGLAASSKLISAELREGTQSETESLRLPQGARVVAIQRLRLADGTPMAIEDTRLTPECASVLASDLETGSLHDALRMLGRVPTTALSWISARTATSSEASLLKVPARAPLLVERRIISDQNDTPLEFTTTAYDAAKYVIDAVFTLAEPQADG